MNNKTVIIMRGQSGAGKSTYVKNHFPGATVCSADNFHINQKGVYDWKPENVGKSHGYCRKCFVEALKRGDRLVVVDNTNTKLKEMEFYVEVAKKSGYDVRIIRLKTPVEVAAKRNVHGVPLDTVKAMHARMQNIPADWGKEEVVSGEK